MGAGDTRVTSARNVAGVPTQPTPEQPGEGSESPPPRKDLEGEGAGKPALTPTEDREDHPSSQCDWEPETAKGAEGWQEKPPVPLRRKRKGREDPDTSTEEKEQEDSKVKRVEPMGPPPTTLEDGEMEGAPPPSPQVDDSSSYSREEESAQVGTPHHSAEASVDEAEASPGLSETALPSKDGQGGPK
ncbi:basic salivary proline-rich protein 2-like [Harpegnathos saltator]|uniref:basic salivary proline-rich protein 2-like n=1 Tax=Harpegnathos saltator TaxID=610380 RepID=UPI000DBEDA88|nr:basic salivary proline-rich protein 2-like [Harpegnathos saltator]